MEAEQKEYNKALKAEFELDMDYNILHDFLLDKCYKKHKKILLMNKDLTDKLGGNSEAIDTTDDRIIISRDVALPVVEKEPRYPIYQMKVGDSFWTSDKNALGYCNRWGTYKKKLMKFTARREENGYRVWRTK